MTPVVFDKCFGWLHNASGDTGVVLCNPYGHEALWAHRSWRGMAEYFAAADMPTLRFDYRGTGDSAESEDQGDRFDAWIESVVDAVRFLRETTKVNRVVLCGIRLGGLLAATAARRLSELGDGVDGLILMAPVTSGREYLRELKLIQRRWRNTSAPHIAVDDANPSYIETIGFRLHASTAARLEKFNLLRETAATVRRVLILDPVKVAAADTLRDFYGATGASVTVTDFPDYAHLMSESTVARPPANAYTTLTQWLADGAVSAPSNFRAAVFDASTAALRVCADGGAPVLEDDGYVETPIIFGNGRLFGIYCRPSTRSDTASASVNAQETHADERGSLKGAHNDVLNDAPKDSLKTTLSGIGSDPSQYAVLFSNTAGNHHIGEARMWVQHARRLARQGVASLRMDVGLLGDSATAAASLSVANLHDPQSIKDVSSGIDWLVEAGHSRPTAVGICSGAYLTLHAAAGNPRVAGAVLINQREYLWVEGREHQASVAIASEAVYRRSARSMDKWKRLLAGQIDIAPIVAGLTRRRVRQWKERAAHVIGVLGGKESAKSIVRQKFVALQKRGVSVRVVYGDFDEGLEESNTFFGKHFKWLKRLSVVQTATESSMDHALFLYPARDVMMDIVDTHLSEQALSPIDRQAMMFSMPTRKKYAVPDVMPTVAHSVTGKR